METKIEARIAELEAYRQQLIADANAELQRVAGALAELRRLLDEPATDTQAETDA